MKKTILSLILAFSSVLSAGAYAGAIYSVSVTDGTALITGTITADAVDGITDFSLNVSGTGAGTIDVSPFVVFGSTDGDLIINPTELIFDGYIEFSDGSNTILLFEDFGGEFGIEIESELDSYFSVGDPLTAPLVIATAGSVPEPSTLLILGMGLTGLGLNRRRLRKS